MRHASGWIGGLAGLAVVGGAVLSRSPSPPPLRAATAQLAAPGPGATHARPLFAPACSAVYRSDGCEMARHTTWKA